LVFAVFVLPKFLPKVAEAPMLLGRDEKLCKVLLCWSTFPLRKDDDAGDSVTDTPGSEFNDLELPPSVFPHWLRFPPPFGTSRWTLDLTLVLAAEIILALTKFFLTGGGASTLFFFDPLGELVCDAEGEEGRPGRS